GTLIDCREQGGHLVHLKIQGVPELCDLLRLQATDSDFSLNLFPRLERWLLAQLGVTHALIRKPAGNQFHFGAPVPSGAQRHELLADGRWGNATAFGGSFAIATVGVIL